MKNNDHPQGGYYKFIIMALLKDGPLTLGELEEKTFCLNLIWVKDLILKKNLII